MRDLFLGTGIAHTILLFAVVIAHFYLDALEDFVVGEEIGDFLQDEGIQIAELLIIIVSAQKSASFRKRFPIISRSPYSLSDLLRGA